MFSDEGGNDGEVMVAAVSVNCQDREGSMRTQRLATPFSQGSPCHTTNGSQMPLKPVW